MSLSTVTPTLLSLALLASACSNISTSSPALRTKQDLSYRGESLTERLDVLSPDGVQVSGGKTDEEQKPVMDEKTSGEDLEVKNEEISSPTEKSQKEQKSTSDFQFEEEPKRKEIEIPVVNLGETESGSDQKTDPKNNDCAALKGISGQWSVRSGNVLVQSTNLFLIQDFNSVKTYSANTSSSHQVEPRDSGTSNDESEIAPLSYVQMEAATVQYDTSSCKVTIQKDLEESSSTYLITGVGSDGAEFKLKKCTDEQCKSTSEEKTYLKN
jgi:hypothetical protein